MWRRKFSLEFLSAIPASGSRRPNSESRPSVDVAVAASLLAGGRRAAQVWDDGFEISNQQGEALGFRTRGEHLLLEIEIERQRSGKVERHEGGIGGGKILARARDAENLRVQSHRA